MNKMMVGWIVLVAIIAVCGIGKLIVNRKLLKLDERLLELKRRELNER